MSQNELPVSTPDSIPEPASSPQWGPNAPRGARAVLNRMIKEGATVPLFLGQTLVNSLRDLGYDHPTSAVCEHVDNAIQWGAKEVRVAAAPQLAQYMRTSEYPLPAHSRSKPPECARLGQCPRRTWTSCARSTRTGSVATSAPPRGRTPRSSL